MAGHPSSQPGSELPGWTRPDQGVLFVVSGPSGVGKSTLIKEAVETLPGLEFSVSATTRPPRAGEQDGVDYHFLTMEEFSARRTRGEFLELAHVYDHAYGTLEPPVHEAITHGRSLVLDIDVQGARQIREKVPEAVLIMVVPPDLAVLEARLRERATDAPEVVARRMAQVAEQVGAVGHFDYVVVNDVLSTAHRVFQGIFLAEMSRVPRRDSVVQGIETALAARGRDA